MQIYFRRLARAVAALASIFLIAGATPATALVIDTSGGAVPTNTQGWPGSGQSLTIDANENHLNDIGFYFADEANGETFDFEIRDALNGGTLLFSTSIVVSGEFNVINVGQAFLPGSVIYAQIDNNGFRGNSTQYVLDSYAGGAASFGEIGSQSIFDRLDLRFIANFSGAPVPEPSIIGLLCFGFVGLGVAKRRQRHVK